MSFTDVRVQVPPRAPERKTGAACLFFLVRDLLPKAKGLRCGGLLNMQGKPAMVFPAYTLFLAISRGAFLWGVRLHILSREIRRRGRRPAQPLAALPPYGCGVLPAGARRPVPPGLPGFRGDGRPRGPPLQGVLSVKHPVGPGPWTGPFPWGLGSSGEAGGGRAPPLQGVLPIKHLVGFGPWTRPFPWGLGSPEKPEGSGPGDVKNSSCPWRCRSRRSDRRASPGR